MNDDDNDNNCTTTEEKKKKKKPAIRHAEKRRTSTCIFADRVAKISVDHYKSTIKIENRPPQTCIATILAHCAAADDDDDNDNDNEGTLWVLSMGVGTKFLSEACLHQEVENETYGSRVRDMHAEVLARRAFRRQLTLEILNDLQEQEQRNGTNKIVNNNNNTNGKRSRSRSILVRSGSSNNNNNIDKNTDNNNNNNNIIRYKLRKGVTIHMYTSSAPCGNATLKKFCKMTKERFREDLGTDEWPDLVHERPPGHSIKLGEFALLLKKDNDSNHSNNNNNNNHNNNSICIEVPDKDKNKIPSQSLSSPPSSSSVPNTTSTSTTDFITEKKRTRTEYKDDGDDNPVKQSSKRRAGKPWPANVSDDWTPPGTTIVGFRDKGSIHTCSDKICRWNYLGLQGSLLASLLEEPIYISTLTVGRKLSGSVCRRAICCRLDTRCRQPTLDESSSTTINTSSKKYRINHPAVIGTSVYLDTGVVDTGSNVDVTGQDVRFHSSVSWVWWLGSYECNNTISIGTVECIDSTSGLVVNLSSDEQQQQHHTNSTVAPRVSTKELTSAFVQAYNLATNFNNIDIDGAESISINNDDSDDKIKLRQENQSLCFSTLIGLRQVKKICSPIHEEFKDLLLTKHKVLSHWRRRINKEST
jgi:hypothetical protein